MKTIKFILVSIFIIVFASCNRNSNKVNIIAHRCLTDSLPENTLAALHKSIEMGVKAVEIDIWRTTDDSLIVFHDRETERLTGEKKIIPESSSTELRMLNLPQNQKIPFLSEVLDALPKDMTIYIEIKCCWEPGKMGSVFPMLKDLIQKRKLQDQVVIISFNPESLKESKQYIPTIPTLLLSYEANKEKELIQKAIDYKVEGIDVYYEILNDTLVNYANKANLWLYIWTLDDPKIAATLMQQYPTIKGITTDKPCLIKKELELLYSTN